nr:hopanoid biosynthesis-associated RND transporter HpnN [Deltaproteobacteria bacterium]
MFKYLRSYGFCLPSWWIPWVLKHSFIVLTAAICLTCVLTSFMIGHFKINADLTEMISNDLHFRKVAKIFHNAFPALHNTIVVVIEADTPEQAAQARDLLALNLRSDRNIFKSVYTPGGGPFFHKNGLMYMSPEKIEDLTDRLSEIQPFIAILSQDFSLQGLLSLIEKSVVKHDELIQDHQDLISFFDRLSSTFEKVVHGTNHRMSWQELMFEQETNTPSGYQFIIIQPFLDYRATQPAQKALKRIRGIADELHINKENGIKINITGRLAINHDDLLSVRRDIGIAGIVSIILVGIILYVGLGSARLVFVSLFTLFTGLIWTLGFALLFIGSLNLMSITFIVLFIGLGIDYSIQICLHYKELRSSGLTNPEAILKGVRSVSNTLILCSITTAIGFYAYVPTAYVGASELGLIAGTGMFLNLLANITVLPALMNLIPPQKSNYLALSLGRHISKLLDAYAVPIVVGAIVSGMAAATIMHKVSFDANPLNLSDPTTDSVVTARGLLGTDRGSLWTISILVSDRQEARNIAKRLRKLNEVETVITIYDLVPENQIEKLDLINDMALILPPAPELKRGASYTPEQNKKALESLYHVLVETINSNVTDDKSYISAITRLLENIQEFSRLLADTGKERELFKALETSLLSNLEILLENFNDLMQAEKVELADLPEDLARRYVSDDGLYRVQVFPRNDITDRQNLKKFVTAVRTIAPDATDKPVTILESGKTISSAFKTATLLAFVLITLFLRIVYKRWVEVLLVMFPVLLGLLYTMAATVLLNIPFNFANIIVIPLLLGIGLDFSIHIMNRTKENLGPNTDVLETSTSRAVLFSALTTIISFGILSFMHHAGTASMGKLLTICISFMIISTLLVLPALLKIYKPYKQQDPS